MISLFQFSVASNAILSINLSLFTFNKSEQKQSIIEVEEDGFQKEDQKKETLPSKNDYKTLLYGSHADRIEEFNENVNAYFFICRDRISGIAWHWVAPIIQGVTSQKTLQYALGGFALEGCGGGLNATKSIIFHLKQLEKRGYLVNYVPRLINNELLHSFQFVDTTIKLQDLITESVDLILYREDKFKYIFKQYEEILSSYKLD
ncbi:MAG: hypothetical protein ACK5N4_03945 [Parabacteroides gordonii]|uniref:hypothetical protein n=1 Tax=Parabacteroides gordonii TaxID=574930 RepID=UPI003A86CF5B